jgi:hypothetical protein
MSTTTVPPRFKAAADYTADDIAKQQAAKAAGDPIPKPETAEYLQLKADLLRAGGLTEEADEIEAAATAAAATGADAAAGTQKNLEDMTPADHAAARRAQ